VKRDAYEDVMRETRISDYASRITFQALDSSYGAPKRKSDAVFTIRSL